MNLEISEMMSLELLEEINESGDFRKNYKLTFFKMSLLESVPAAKLGTSDRFFFFRNGVCFVRRG